MNGKHTKHQTKNGSDRCVTFYNIRSHSMCYIVIHKHTSSDLSAISIRAAHHNPINTSLVNLLPMKKQQNFTVYGKMARSTREENLEIMQRTQIPKRLLACLRHKCAHVNQVFAGDWSMMERWWRRDRHKNDDFVWLVLSASAAASSSSLHMFDNGEAERLRSLHSGFIVFFMTGPYDTHVYASQSIRYAKRLTHSTSMWSICLMRLALDHEHPTLWICVQVHKTF